MNLSPSSNAYGTTATYCGTTAFPMATIKAQNRISHDALHGWEIVDSTARLCVRYDKTTQD